jgi:ribokinase
MIVVFGSINLDLVFPLPALPGAGDTVLARSMRIEPGGKGANQAVAAARNGARVIMAGAVGRDAFADGALGGLRGAEIDVSRVAQVDEVTGVAAICVDEAGNNAIAVGSGANLAARAGQIEDALLGPGTILLLQMETEAEEVATLIRRARARGAYTILNLAPAKLLDRDALRAVDLLVANKMEAAWLGTHLGTGVNAASIRAALGVDVVRTIGGEGAELATAAGHTYIPEHPIVPVDTTSAGDCFVGVLAAGLDRGLPLTDALHRAAVGAAVCCTRWGTQTSLPYAREIDEAIKSYNSSRPAKATRDE